MSAPLRPLLSRRLVIVTGKGGTGKTSVVGALALAAAERGRRVLVAETGRDEHLPRLLAPGSAPVGYAGRELRPRLHVMRIDPYEALAEYLALQIGLRGVVARVLHNRGFRQLMDAAPGWRELITLGKVWHLEQQRDAQGAPLYDLLVVDAPATGHGLTFLDAPRVVGSAVRTGPLGRNAELVAGMLQNPETTLLLPVALGEELPARETIELVERVRSEIGVPMDRVVVNAVVADPYPPGMPDLHARLARLPESTPLHGLPPPAVLARCAQHLRARHLLNAQHRAEIGRATGLPVCTLPLLPDGVRGPEDLAVLAARLEDDLRAEAA